MSSSNSNINHRGHQLPHHNSQEIRHRTSSSISSSGKNDAPSLFVEDRRGDRRNVEFAAPDRYAIPRYYTVGGGALIGLSPNYRITSKSETRREVQNVGLDSGRKSRTQSLLAGLTGDDGSLIKARRSPSQNDDLQQDFLSFSHGRPRKRRRFSNDLDGSASSAESSDSSDGETGQHGKTEQDTFDAFKEDPVHRHHVELSRATSERPQDVNVWLNFIKYQEVFFGARHEHRSTNSAATSRSLADLRISLYERALCHVKDPAGRHTLILGLMQEGSKIWDVQKQASQWQVFLGKDSSFDLWILYLNFMQSNALKFNLDTCLQVYKKCLTKFASSPGDDGPIRDSHCVYLLLRLTLLLWQSGFTERAVGIWQAMLEFNLFRPSQLSTDMGMSAFEQFWSSEVPRIGEDGATGWFSNSNTEPEPKVDKESPQVAMTDSTTWAKVEADLEKYAPLPARAIDDVPDDDPYRILLFSDIQDFIFSIESKKGFELLRDAFLLFLGLPPCHLLLHEPQKWKEDPFIYTPSLAVSNPDILTGTRSDTTHTTFVSTSLHDVFLTVKSIMASSEESDTISSSSSKRPVHVVLDSVRRAVSQIARIASNNTAPDEDMMEYSISLEARIDFKSARKQAKSFLKKNPNSLRLYNVYALIENEAGTFEAAEKVWSTALSMQPDLPSESQQRRDTLILWRDWNFSYMKQKRFHHARTLLSMITDKTFDFDRLRQAEISENSKPSAANQVKVEQYLRLEFSACRVLLERQNRTSLSVIADLLALQKYLNGGGGVLCLGDALEAYRDLLDEIKLNKTSEMDLVSEEIHKRRAQFVYSHSTIYAQPYRPKESWQVIAESIRMFPNNRTLITLHHYFLQKSGLIDRLRQVDVDMDTDTTSAVDGVRTTATVTAPHQVKNNVTSVEFNLEVELNRPSYSGSTDHSIRSAFKRATDQHSPGFHSIDIWKSYIMWESSLSGLVVSGREVPADDEKHRHKKKREHAQSHPHQQYQRQKLTNLTEAFYSAIRACPWSKELYMLAFTDQHLVSALGDGDGLKRLYESMMDRGLRLRTNVS